MHDIVAIKVQDKKYGEGGFITWGRLYHAINDKELLEVIKKHYSRWGSDLESIELCYSLQEISHLPYFYESLIRFTPEFPIPSGEEYKIWAKQKKSSLDKGHEISFCGFTKPYEEYLERKKAGFPDND